MPLVHLLQLVGGRHGDLVECLARRADVDEQVHDPCGHRLWHLRGGLVTDGLPFGLGDGCAAQFQQPLGGAVLDHDLEDPEEVLRLRDLVHDDQLVHRGERLHEGVQVAAAVGHAVDGERVRGVADDAAGRERESGGTDGEEDAGTAGGSCHGSRD